MWKIQFSGPNTNTNLTVLTFLANEEEKITLQIQIYLNTIFKTNTNKNIFWCTSADMNTKFYDLDWYLKIQTQIWINSTQNDYMLTKLNAIKVCKFLYICAIIYDFF